jgi:hypothetical protein
LQEEKCGTHCFSPTLDLFCTALILVASQSIPSSFGPLPAPAVRARSRTTLTKYQLVFRHLLRVKQVERTLQDSWVTLQVRAAEMRRDER